MAATLYGPGRGAATAAMKCADRCHAGRLCAAIKCFAGGAVSNEYFDIAAFQETTYSLHFRRGTMRAKGIIRSSTILMLRCRNAGRPIRSTQSVGRWKGAPAMSALSLELSP